MKRNSHQALTAFIVIGAAVLISLFFVARAASPKDIVFPISELGNCKSETECRAYCEQRDNADIIRACLTFAKKYNLLPRDVIAKGEKFADVAAGGGPGGCKAEKPCVAYCENIAHIEECVSFAERHDLLPKEELAEAKKVASALRAGAKLPGSCTGKENCVAYCENPAHIDECLAFAEKAGIISPDELAMAKKVAPFLKRGETPGGCKSKAECETYCANPSNFESCITFAQKLGVMSAREAELLKKTQGRSPGDCARGAKTAEEARANCSVFCNKSENVQTCTKFAAEIGIMSAEEASQVGAFQDFQACYAISPGPMKSCLEEHLGPEILSNLLKGIMPGNLEDVENMVARIREARTCTNRYADQQLQTITNDPDALACVDSEMGKGFLDKLKSGGVACGDASVFQKKVATCMENALGKKLDQCFALGCSEATTCLKNLQGQSKKPIGEEKVVLDSSFEGKISAKLNSCVVEQMRSCLAKDCSELIPCLSRFQGGEGTQKQEKGGNLDPAFQAEMNARIGACTKQGGGSTGQPQGGQQQQQQQQQKPQTPGGQQYPQEGQIPQEYCSKFASTPSCSYVGEPGSQNYNYCKQCFPDK